jgi:hypothetical protein
LGLDAAVKAEGVRDHIMIAAQQKLSALRFPLLVIRIMEDDRVA